MALLPPQMAALSFDGPLKGEDRGAAKGAGVEGGVGAVRNLTLEPQVQVEIACCRRSARRIGQGRQRIVENAVGIELGVDRVCDPVTIHYLMHISLLTRVPSAESMGLVI